MDWEQARARPVVAILVAALSTQRLHAMADEAMIMRLGAGRMVTFQIRL